MSKVSYLKDRLFQGSHYHKKKFEFDQQVAGVFDDMLYRSIPHYQEVIEISKNFLSNRVKKNNLVYDLGSSTGNFLLELAESFSYPIRGIGIDNSSAMVEKANTKLKYKRKNIFKKICFQCQNVIDIQFKPCQAVVLHYTLQFIPPIKRKILMTKIWEALTHRGVVVISEKVVEQKLSLDQYFIEQHNLFKKIHRYTDVEIARKKEALDKILIPYTPERYLRMFKQIGFSESSIAFKWHNFITFFLIK